MTDNRRVVILTGASSGIGRAVAETMADENTCITLVARRENKLDEVASRIESEGGRARVEACDVRNSEAMQSVVDGTLDDFGRLDYVLANAGVSWKTEAHDLDAEDVRQTFRINVDGMINLFGPALDVMLDRDHGQLVAVSSMASFHGLPGKAAYCASKAAMARIAESFRLDLADTGIGVTTVYPGYVKTPMTDHYGEEELPFLVPVDEAAQKIVTAVENRARRCVFPWQMKLMTDFMNFLPSGFVDWLVRRTAAKMSEEAPTGPA
jgi:short-subunit dehydrogenase